MTTLLNQETPTGLASSPWRVALAFVVFVAVVIGAVIALMYGFGLVVSLAMMVVLWTGAVGAYRAGADVRATSKPVWIALISAIIGSVVFAVMSLVMPSPPYSVSQSMAMSLIRIGPVVTWAYVAGLFARNLTDALARWLAAVGAAGILFGLVLPNPGLG